MLDIQLPLELVLTIISAVVVTLLGWFAFASRMDGSINSVSTAVAVVKENTNGISEDIHRLETLCAKHQNEIERLRARTDVLTDRQERITLEIEKLRSG